MQAQNSDGDAQVALVQFAHVDPSTGKFTNWSFSMTKASLEKKLAG